MGSLVSVVRPGELTSILPAKKKISFNHIDKLTKQEEAKCHHLRDGELGGEE